MVSVRYLEDLLSRGIRKRTRRRGIRMEEFGIKVLGIRIEGFGIKVLGIRNPGL